MLLARKIFFGLDPERMFSLSGLENMEFICQVRNNLKHVARGYLGIDSELQGQFGEYEPSQILVVCLYLVVSDPALSILHVANPNTGMSTFLGSTAGTFLQARD